MSVKTRKGHLITKEDGSPFREELKYLGNCEFYVTKMPNAPREIDWMRKNHQVIERYTRKTALKEDYVGIFICSDPKGNELLATLEPPAHDKWDTTQAKDEKFTSLYGNNYGEKALSEIKNWTRNILKGLRREDLLEAGEFLDLSNFLPMDEEEILSGNLLKKNIKKAEFETAAERHTDATNKGTITPPKKKKILKPLDEDNTSSDDSNKLPGEDEPNTQGNDDNNNDNNNGNTNGSGSSNGKNEDPKDDKEQDSKNQKSGNFSEVYYRIFKLPTRDNTYRIKLSPSTDFKGNLSLSAKGEENSSENINISSIVNTTLSNIKHKDNRLLDIELKKDSKVSIDIEVDSNLKLALELKNE